MGSRILELTDIAGSCSIVCGPSPVDHSQQLKLELVKSLIIKEGDYEKFVSIIHEHFKRDRSKYYIKSIRNEWDTKSLSLTDQPLLNYIKPNNLYYIEFEERCKMGKCLWIFPLIIPQIQNMQHAIQYQHCGPLIVYQQQVPSIDIWKMVHEHFGYNLWDEQQRYSNAVHNECESEDEDKSNTGPDEFDDIAKK